MIDRDAHLAGQSGGPRSTCASKQGKPGWRNDRLHRPAPWRRIEVANNKPRTSTRRNNARDVPRLA
jgi:hypothetical protein